MQPELRVLYLAPSCGYGGAETFLLSTARFHDPRRIEALYVCFRDGPLVGQLRALGKTVFLLEEAPRLRNPLSVLRCVLKIRGIARERKIDIIHSTMAYGALFGSWAARLAGCRHVWFQHGPVTGWQDKLAARLPASLTFVNSTYTGREQKRLYAKQSLRRITLGVDIEMARAALAAGNAGITARSQWQVESDSFVVGSVCRPQPQKGLELLVEAIGLAQAKSARKVEAIVLGANSPSSAYEESLLRLIEKTGAPVRLLPAIPNPLSVMPGFDCFVSSAISPEAFGLTLVEAMAMGIPVIAPKEGGPLDIIEDRKTGYFFEPRSAVSLAEQIVFLANENERQNQAIARLAKSTAEKKFNARDSIGNLEHAYQEAIRAI